MKESIRMLAVLTALTLVSAALLATVHHWTAGPIEAAAQREKLEALRRVLPACDNDLLADALRFGPEGSSRTVYVARHLGQVVGFALEAESDGYGGPLRVAVGLTPEGEVHGVIVIQADRETPGLGSRVREAAFLGAFRGLRSQEARAASLTQDGGRVEAVTGATISSRGVARAVRASLEWFAHHQADIHRAVQSERRREVFVPPPDEVSP